MSEAGPVFSVRVVLLGKIRLQRSELLAAKARPDSLGPPPGASAAHRVVQSRLRAADGLLPLGGDLILSLTHTHTHTLTLML